MDRVRRNLTVTALVVLAAASVQWVAAAQGRPLYVSITNSKGDPQPGVTADDLMVQVNGKPAAVSRVTQAAGPVSIVVITEGIRRDLISDIRKMMKATVSGAMAIHPDSRVGLMVDDGARAPKMHPVTKEIDELNTEIGRYFESSQNSPLLDSILTAAQVLSFESNARRAIIVVTRGQADAMVDVLSPTRISQAVRASGASFWALDLGGRDDPDGAAEQRVLSEVTAASGGRHERTTMASIISQTERILATLKGQYAIHLEDGFNPKTASPKVTAKSKDLKVLAPSWK